MPEHSWQSFAELSRLALAGPDLRSTTQPRGRAAAAKRCDALARLKQADAPSAAQVRMDALAERVRRRATAAADDDEAPRGPQTKRRRIVGKQSVLS